MFLLLSAPTVGTRRNNRRNDELGQPLAVGELVHPTARGRGTSCAVEFTGFVSSRLSPVEREALSSAVEQVNDFLLSELVELYNETARPAAMRMFSSLFLPDRHVAFCDFAMIRRMHVCFVVVAGRLQDRWVLLTVSG